MTEPRFKVSDGVYVPSDRGLKDPYRGAGGKVIKVNPGTGPDAQIGDSSDRILWTSLPLLIWLISGHPWTGTALERWRTLDHEGGSPTDSTQLEGDSTRAREAARYRPGRSDHRRQWIPNSPRWIRHPLADPDMKEGDTNGFRSATRRGSRAGGGKVDLRSRCAEATTRGARVLAEARVGARWGTETRPETTTAAQTRPYPRSTAAGLLWACCSSTPCARHKMTIPKAATASTTPIGWDGRCSSPYSCQAVAIVPAPDSWAICETYGLPAYDARGYHPTSRC